MTVVLSTCLLWGVFIATAIYMIMSGQSLRAVLWFKIFVDLKQFFKSGTVPLYRF